MDKLLTFLLFTLLSSTARGATDCDASKDEIDYNGEFCITISELPSNYTTAKVYCGGLANPASLVVVKDQNLQDFITNITAAELDNLWLGAKKENGSEEYKWEDGTAVSEFHWALGYPRNISNSDVCISLHPANAKKAAANWENAACSRQYLAICQRPVNLSWNEIVTEIRAAKVQIEVIRRELENMQNRTVPIASVYVEYSDQKSPAELWPDLQWEDVTNLYAGLFFRASGNGSEDWGVTQAECAPRITHTEYMAINGSNPLTIPAAGWSDFGLIGYHSSMANQNGLRYNTEGCEVRPKNQAIRMWKRIA